MSYLELKDVTIRVSVCNVIGLFVVWLFITFLQPCPTKEAIVYVNSNRHTKSTNEHDRGVVV